MNVDLEVSAMKSLLKKNSKTIHEPCTFKGFSYYVVVDDERIVVAIDRRIFYILDR